MVTMESPTPGAPPKTVAMTTVVQAPVGRTILMQGSALPGPNRAHAEQYKSYRSTE